MIASILAEKPLEIKEKREDRKQKLFRNRYKITIKEQLMLYKILEEKPEVPSPILIVECKIDISVSQLNRLRKEWGKSNKWGRAKKRRRKTDRRQEDRGFRDKNSGKHRFKDVFWVVRNSRGI